MIALRAPFDGMNDSMQPFFNGMGGSVSASRNRMICIARLIPAGSQGNNGRRGWQASAESRPPDVALLVTSRHSTAAWRRAWHLEYCRDRRIWQRHGAASPQWSTYFCKQGRHTGGWAA